MTIRQGQPIRTEVMVSEPPDGLVVVQKNIPAFVLIRVH